NLRVKVAGTTIKDFSLAKQSVMVTQPLPGFTQKVPFGPPVTIPVFAVPITFEFGAITSVGIDGTVEAESSLDPFGGAKLDVALTPNASIGGYASAALKADLPLGLGFSIAKAMVTLDLAKAALSASAGGVLNPVRNPNGTLLALRGSLFETLTDDWNFMDGK